MAERDLINVVDEARPEYSKSIFQFPVFKKNLKNDSKEAG